MAERLTDTSSPTIQELCKELKGVNEWEKLGINLKDMKYDVIKEIKEDEKTLETRKMEIFSKWLKHCPKASWEDVVAALESINENTIAKEVTDKYITDKDTGISSMTQVDDTSKTATDCYFQVAQMESPLVTIPPVRLPEPETGVHIGSHGMLYPQLRSHSFPDHIQVHKTKKERFFETYHTESEPKTARVKIHEIKDRELKNLLADLKTQVKKSEQQVTNLRLENITLKQELKQRSETKQELKHVRQELQEIEHKMHRQEQELQNTKRELEETEMQWDADKKKLNAKFKVQIDQNNKLEQKVNTIEQKLERTDRDSKQELYRLRKKLKESTRELEQKDRDSEQKPDRVKR